MSVNPGKTWTHSFIECTPGYDGQCCLRQNSLTYVEGKANCDMAGISAACAVERQLQSGDTISSGETCLRRSMTAAACAGFTGQKSTTRAFPSADLGRHLELLLVARQSEEEILLFSVYAGLAVHRTEMLRIYLLILLVLLTAHTVPTCTKSGTQLTFVNCMTGSS